MLFRAVAPSLVFKAYKRGHKYKIDENYGIYLLRRVIWSGATTGKRRQ